MNANLQTRRKLLAQQWRQRSVGERRALITLGVFIAAVVFWFWLWQPINDHINETNARLPQARAELDVARNQWREAAGLTRQTPEISSDARAVFMRVTERFSVASAITHIDVRENQIDCTFSSLPFADLVSLVDALQKEEFFYIVSATVTPLSQGNNVRAELLFARP